MTLTCVANAQIQAQNYASVQEFCLGAPRGAYTTTHVRDNFVVLEWELHIKRLIKSIAAVHASLEVSFADYYTALEKVGIDASI